MKRKMVLMTSGHSRPGTAKTAVNLIRYRPEEVLAVLDPDHAGKTTEEVLGLGGGLPVVAALSECPEADTLVIGIAPSGGKLPLEMRVPVLEALERGMTVLSGLHQFLSDDPELASAASKTGGRLVDVRKNNERDVAHRKGINERCLRIHTVGHDCNVGKMVVSVEVTQALQRLGHDAKFVATGQTGIMIEGDGCPVDAVVSDFVNGAAEKLVLANQAHDILLIEGQGTLVHPRYSAVTLGLLHGCMPHGLIFCYEMGRTTISGMDHVPIVPMRDQIKIYETMASVMHPCRVIAIAMNSRRFSDAEAALERERVRAEFGLPVCDVIRHGTDELVEAVLAMRRELDAAAPSSPAAVAQA